MNQNQDERLSRLEGKVAGILAGQSELRSHIDGKIDGLVKAVDESNREKPISGPSWAFILLALSAVLGNLVEIFLLIEYLF